MTTKISWAQNPDGTAGETWNPITGCTKVSAGCKNCYAEGVANRFWATQYPEVDGRPRRFTDVQCHPDRLEKPLRWTKPRRVFVNSMSDLFHEDVPDEYRVDVFAVMARTRQHKYQILTKRPERMRAFLAAPDIYARVRAAADDGTVGRMAFDRLSPAGQREKGRQWWTDLPAERWPLPNVWLGVSVEDQATADARIPLLLATPAAVRWVSLEPQLGPVDLTFVDHINALYPDWVGGKGGGTGAPHPLLDWVVQGGESGSKARAFYVQWARDVRDQCEHEQVPYFLKQLGLQVVGDAQEFGSARVMSTGVMAAQGVPSRRIDRFRLDSSAGADPTEWPEDLRQCRAWPKVLA